MPRITIESINEELKEFGWSCVSETYKNLESELRFECDEGHTVYASWKKIRTRRECPICKQNAFKKLVDSVKPKPKGEKRILALD